MSEANTAARPVAAQAVTPTIGAQSKKAAFWVGAGVFAIIVALIAMLLTNAAASGGAALDSDNAKPDGGMALAEVLTAQGVTVHPADSLDAALQLVADAPSADDATLLVYDANSILTREQLDRLAGGTHRTVAVDPNFSMLQALAPEIGFGGVNSAGDELLLGRTCVSSAAERAITVAGPDGGTLKTLSVPTDATDYSTCFIADSSAASGATQAVLVQHEQLSFVADPAIFANGSITEAGNAALALGLLGEGHTLVWYLPTLADVAETGPPSLAELSPGWVTPVMVLLLLCGIAAAIAAGRRFGPLVIENLPVTVRASETMEGRARLYARTSSRLRALDALRIATISRLARHLGLARTASVHEVVAAAASVTAQNPSAVQAVLVDEVPRTDADLLALSDKLLDLERAVETRTRPAETPASASHPLNERMEP